MQNILTSDDLRETKKHGLPDFPLEYYLDDTREFYNYQINWHWHNEFEILYVLEGTAICHIDRHTITLNSGEAIFINSSILHQFTSDNYGLLPNIVFAPAFIAPSESSIYKKYVAPLERSSLSYIIFKKDIAWQNQVLNTLEILFKHLSARHYNELLIRNTLCEAWLIMLENIDSSLLERRNRINEDLSHNAIPIMIQYIQSHYMESITLEDIASVANISKNTAIRYFQKHIDVSPVDYLIKYRMSVACRMLKETADKISHISSSVGYENKGYFSKLFKKSIGLSPKEYRNSHHQFNS